MSNISIQIGDIVVLGIPIQRKAKDHKGTEFTISHFSSPKMTVIEICIDDNKSFNEINGNPIESNTKALCQWYNPKIGIFEDKWFKLSCLHKIKEEATFLTPKLLEKVKKDKGLLMLQSGDLNYFMNLNDCKGDNFHSKDCNHYPLMVILDIAINTKNSNLPLFNKKTGLQTKIISSYDEQIKCIWYNPITNKYSENFFIVESLKIIPVLG